MSPQDVLTKHAADLRRRADAFSKQRIEFYEAAEFAARESARLRLEAADMEQAAAEMEKP